ncbi:MAG: hypothetical protein J6V08_01840 [Candidatus Methanomethylophilaceae archaeon]|nr:hypothetical protein [Candidatus Methanomethylophilaceae archaeon]
MDVMPFDELNKFKAAIPIFFNEDGRIKSKADFDSLLDMLEDLFLLSYANGVELTNLSLGSAIEPTAEEVRETIDKKIQGKTWRDRMDGYFPKTVSDSGQAAGTINEVIRIAETEAHRDSNAAAWSTAKKAGATQKIWHTMQDDRVRDSHYYLEGVAAPIDGEFYSFLGNSTQYPGQWGVAEEDVNCRCWLTYK